MAWEKMNSPNLTDHWVREDREPLVLDLSDGAINGVKIGDSISGLSWLGPSDPVQHRDKCIAYYQQGLTLNEVTGTLTGIFVSVSERERMQPFRGTWQHRRTKPQISPNTKRQDIRDLMGTPINEWRDDCEMCLSYENDEHEWDFLWELDGPLQYVDCQMLHSRRQALEKLAGLSPEAEKKSWVRRFFGA